MKEITPQTFWEVIRALRSGATVYYANKKSEVSLQNERSGLFIEGKASRPLTLEDLSNCVIISNPNSDV